MHKHRTAEQVGRASPDVRVLPEVELPQDPRPGPRRAGGVDADHLAASADEVHAPFVHRRGRADPRHANGGRVVQNVREVRPLRIDPLLHGLGPAPQALAGPLVEAEHGLGEVLGPSQAGADEDTAARDGGRAVGAAGELVGPPDGRVSGQFVPADLGHVAQVGQVRFRRDHVPPAVAAPRRPARPVRLGARGERGRSPHRQSDQHDKDRCGNVADPGGRPVCPRAGPRFAHARHLRLAAGRGGSGSQFSTCPSSRRRAWRAGTSTSWTAWPALTARAAATPADSPTTMNTGSMRAAA